MIKTFAIGLALTTAFGSVAFAEQFKLSSKIDHVTVYPQGADVQRLGAANFGAGEHELVFEGLPASLDPQSIRIDGLSGDEIQITSVDYEVKSVDDTTREAQVLATEKQLETLANERLRVTRQIEDTTQQRQLLIQLAQRPFTTPQNANEVIGTDSKTLSEVLALVGVQLKETSDALHAANLRIIAIDKQVADITEKQQSEGPEAQQTATITVHVAATKQAQADLKLQYRIQEAYWSPYYDAKLTIPKTGLAADVELIRRAEVTQNSTESWDNVALTLSTARPNGSTSAPDLGEELLAIEVDEYVRGKAAMQSAPETAAVLEDTESNSALLKQKLEARKAPVPQRQAQLSEVGFQVNYDVQGRVSVSNAGKAKKVRVSSEIITAALSVFTTPRLDAAAYLNADFKLNEKSTLLPGPVSLYRDGTYVGQNALPLLVAGEEVNLGFGVDDLVRVTRKEIKRAGAEKGIISTSHTEDRAWKIDIQNLHDRAMKITVLDRMPVSTRDDVTVAPLYEQTPPTTTAYKDRRGVLAWSFELDSKAEKSLNTGYRVTWPESVKVSVVD